MMLRVARRCTKNLVGGCIAAAAALATTAFSVAQAAAPMPPTVTGVCRVGITKPACLMGPTTGGYQVAIKGANFSGTTVVSFGPTTAPSFTVNSSTRITATVPASRNSNEGVRVQVTANGQTSRADCPLLQLGCDDAFFYADVKSLAASGANKKIPISLQLGGVAFGGFVKLGSWSLGGSLQYSEGEFLSQAVLAQARLSVRHATIHVSMAGNPTTEQDIPLPLRGLPEGASLYLRVIPSLSGTAIFDDHIESDSSRFTIGWAGGQPWFSGSVNCSRMACLGHPHITAHVSGTVVVALWLRLGFDHLNVAAGPVIGISARAGDVLDGCSALQAKVDVFEGPLSHTYNLWGPINISGALASCPLSDV